jgi:hypothetical protein
MKVTYKGEYEEDELQRKEYFIRRCEKVRDVVNYVEELKTRTKTAINAIDILSQQFLVEIHYVNHNRNRNGVYEEDINHFVNEYLREWYKNNPYVTIN